MGKLASWSAEKVELKIDSGGTSVTLLSGMKPGSLL